MERRLERINWKVLSKIVPEKIDRCFLPVGTIEAHGCGPLGTDNIIPEFLAKNLSDEFNAIVAPTIHYGITHSLLPYPGSITIDEKVFEDYILEVLRGISSIGFRKIVIFNGHGGNNNSLKKVVSKIYEERNVFCAVVHWWILCSELTKEFFKESGSHAGVDENAMILAIEPELVDKELYSEEDVYLYNEGLYSVPIPGSVIIYKKDEGKPRFDINEARGFKDKLILLIKEHLDKLFRGWEKIDEFRRGK
uniref:Creatininase family protein n=1 Tax=candidate division WOR-3 bacterium TaxID=2052148 RepID=A0A7C4YGM0_UNCW3